MTTRQAFAIALTCLLVAGATGLAGNVALTPSGGERKTLKFGRQGGLNSLDPYTLNESFTLGTLANVMEGLIRRDKDLNIIPGLAERWEMLNPTRWRFYLRRGVKFHDGSPFTADDVVFSAERSRVAGLPAQDRASPPTPRSRRSTTTPSTSCWRRPTRFCTTNGKRG